MSERWRWAIAAVGLFIVEVLIATVWKRVPFVRADLGDYLVVILLYAMAKAVRPFRALPLVEWRLLMERRPPHGQRSTSVPQVRWCSGPGSLSVRVIG